MQIYQKTEIPAQFGEDRRSFENYVLSAFSIKKLKDQSTQNELVEFVVTCNGEIYAPYSVEKNSEFKNYILELIKKMPKWTPALMNNRKVNELKSYQFHLEKGQLTFIRRI